MDKVPTERQPDSVPDYPRPTLDVSDPQTIAPLPLNGKFKGHWLLLGTAGFGALTTARLKFDDVQGFLFWLALGGLYLFFLGILELLRSSSRPRGDPYRAFSKALIVTGFIIANVVGAIFLTFWPRH